MIHGIETPVNTEMKDTITWQYGRNAVQWGREKQARRHASNQNGKKKRIATQGVKYSKAARGETVKPPEPETYGDAFRIERLKERGRYAIDTHCPARPRMDE
jgi:hypothetical protein